MNTNINVRRVLRDKIATKRHRPYVHRKGTFTLTASFRDKQHHRIDRAARRFPDRHVHATRRRAHHGNVRLHRVEVRPHRRGVERQGRPEEGAVTLRQRLLRVLASRCLFTAAHDLARLMLAQLDRRSAP